jgi:60 kDa SS-A/Ro ribonucleoprotein
MARKNVKISAPAARTHEGAPTTKASALKELRRTLMANMLWEDSFYENGVSAADRMKALVPKVSFEDAAQAAIDAREKFKLRHAPLLVVRELLRNHSGRKVGDLIERVIQRPDEAPELLALYWAEKADAPLTAQLKIGLARALKKFNEYELAKWDRPGAVRLRDVLFLSHARPRGADEKYTRAERKGKKEFELNEHELLFKRLADDELTVPETWEVKLSGGADKKATFEGLINERKLGALALLRNLRGMTEAGVSDYLIRKALREMKTERVLPFRFITAARYAPRFEPELEAGMFKCLAEQPKLAGKTALLVDVSGSMVGAKVSQKSEVDRREAACGVAMLLREVCKVARVFAFSTVTAEVPPRRGFALAEAIKAMPSGGTDLAQAVAYVAKKFPDYDRLIVITDEQSATRPQKPEAKGYIINVGTYKNGIAYGPWVSIDGWSEAVIDFLREHEAEEG